MDLNRQFLLSVGTVLEHVFIFDSSNVDNLAYEVVVIAMRGDGRYVDLGESGRVFPPGRVIKTGSNAQVVDR
jgi:hypothetical protein